MMLPVLIYAAIVQFAFGNSGNGQCVSSIKVVDNFLTDEEAQILLAGVKDKVPDLNQSAVQNFLQKPREMKERDYYDNFANDRSMKAALT